MQHRFLRDAGIDDLTALMQFNLAPLATRRDIAMLGLIHRTVLNKGPPHFRERFKLAAAPLPGEARHHSRHLDDPRLVRRGRVITRSALGLVAVYTLLPNDIVILREVPAFQTALQNRIKSRAEDGCEDWASTLSPRWPLAAPPSACYAASGAAGRRRCCKGGAAS